MTEKNYNSEQKDKKTMQKQKTAGAVAPIIQPKAENSPKEKSSPEGENKTAEAVKDKPKEKKKQPAKKVVKQQVVVNAKSVPISTKYATAICRFIKGKEIANAINDLEQVVIGKKAVPMRGEIPHRKGKGMMSGRFPKRTAEHFIVLLKSLSSNAVNHEVDEPIIASVMANLASRPFGRFGRIRKKRTHVTLVASSKSEIGGRKKTKSADFEKVNSSEKNLDKTEDSKESSGEKK